MSLSRTKQDKQYMSALVTSVWKTVKLHLLKENKNICPLQGSNLRPQDYVMLFITHTQRYETCALAN